MPEAPRAKSYGASAQAGTMSEAKPLKSTLNLPQTAFPMKANLPVNEPLRLAAWEKDDLYGQIRRTSGERVRAGTPKGRYILHDGPPYANGAIHLGHALNKTLKDFVVKTRTMAGYDAPYVPGWDCHGLPIEIKVDEQLGRKKLEMDPVEVRRACREYAQKYLDLQREQFIRMGVFGRWTKPYSTMDAEYEARIAETFFHFFENGFVYKGLKPVSWCIHDRTALAEAEVEYEQHTSPSVYVRYKLTNVAVNEFAAAMDLFKKATVLGKDVYTIIWTTTPWTLPASVAVAFNPRLDYVALQVGSGDVYIVAAELASQVIAACNLGNVTNIASMHGIVLSGATFQHPFLDREVRGVLGDYVTADQGTGAVHTAPAHGIDDFATGKRYGLPEVQYLDDSGRQMHTERFGGSVAQAYEGLRVWKANPVIIELLREKGALLAASEFEHSYPHCWRCHNPVIVRATEQWFIGMDTKLKNADSSPMLDADGNRVTLRRKALAEIQRVKWDPAWGQERITNMVATRPDWCISRQRIWGVPIAVFLCRRCGEPLKDAAINKRVVELFMRESADAWYVRTPEEILPAGTQCACGHAEFRKEMDILDVWFESGASSHAVLDVDPDTQQVPGDADPKNVDPRSDLYAEGGDQHRGWFMSSLLCGIGMHNRAPYKMVATYGWTIDENGKALSKSMGSQISSEITDKLGAEIVRLWVASVDFREDVVASMPLLKRLAEEIYRKQRNTFRFLLGALRELDPTTGEERAFDPRPMVDGGDAVAFSAMQPIDQYILARAAELTKKIRAAYDAMEFHRVYHLLNEFLNSELSAFYLDVLKDRLYTYPVKYKDGNEYQRELYVARRSAQTAIYKITDALARLTAPILSFTADEVWQHIPGKQGSVHLTLFPEAEDFAPDVSTEFIAEWDELLKVRGIVLQQLEIMRSNKEIGKSLEAEFGSELELDASYDPERANASTRAVAKYRDSLAELFGLSRVAIEPTGVAHESIARFAEGRPMKSNHPKCDRCWRHVPDVGSDAQYPSVCHRCAEALDAIDFPSYRAAV